MANEDVQLTAVLAALDSYAEVADALYWLNQQTARNRLEVMVVCERLTQFDIPDNLQQQVGPVSFVECGPGRTLAEARAFGCRRATTPWVVFLEDHAFPEPAWCERVLERLQEGWTAVGGAFLSANPQTLLAQAQILIGYGQWLLPVAAREMPYVSGHGTAYRREALLEQEQKLEDYFLAESLLMAELRNLGHRFYCESEVACWHFDPSRWAGASKVSICVGRVLAAQRSAAWSGWLRFVIGLGSPLIALIRLWRAISAFFRIHAWTGFSPLSLPIAAVVCCLWAGGEWLGFWFGFGNSRQQLSDREHNRKRDLRLGEWPKPTRPVGMSEAEFRRRTGQPWR